MERQLRRAFRGRMAAEFRKLLPDRHRVLEPSKAHVARLFDRARQALGQVAEQLELQEDHFVVHKVERSITAFAGPGTGPAMAGMGAPGSHGLETQEFYWAGRRREGPVKDIRMVKVETAADGETVLRVKVVLSS